MLALLVLAVALEFYEPQIILAIGLGLYLLHLPYAGWRFQYLKRHPELWMDARQQRISRSSTRRVGRSLGPWAPRVPRSTSASCRRRAGTTLRRSSTAASRP